MALLVIVVVAYNWDSDGLGVYIVSRWELEEWVTILSQKMYKQTLIITRATEEATMDVIMVHRHNHETVCYSI